MNKAKFKDYHKNLMQRLKNQELIIAYLNEALADEDERVFLLALKDVLKAREVNVTSPAEEVKLNHHGLSVSGNPRWTTITSLIKALGLQLHISAQNK